LKRYYGRGDLHFVTFSCYRRLDLLRSKHARTLFVQELARVWRERRFWLAGYVVMPNHVHMLMSEPIQGTVSTALQLLKQRVSRKMRKRKKRMREGQLTLGFDTHGEELRSFWQARFCDFTCTAGGK
jgi:putative transposase